MTDAKNNKTKNPKGFVLALALAGQVSLLLVGPVVVCLGLGIWLDNTFSSTPVLLIAGVITGFAISMINVFRVMKIMEKAGE